jgi:hypothetical protein
MEIFGDLDEQLLTRPLELAFGHNRFDRRWRNAAMTVRDLINDYLADFERGDKDGACVMQGNLAGTGERKKNLVPRCYLLMLDHDNGLTMDDVHRQVAERGLFAVLWHTHSHGKPFSTIAESKLTQYMKAAFPNTSQVSNMVVQSYFRERGIEEAIVETMQFKGMRMGPNGAEALVEHAPMSRVRSLFVLNEPFDFMARGGTQREALEEWAERYAGFSKRLGVPFDSSCTDPSRLMYLPRIAQDADESNFEIRVVAGRALDIEDMPRYSAKAQAQRAERTGNAFEKLAAQTLHDTQFKTKGLKVFLAKHGHDFEAADWLLYVAPDDQRPGGPANGTNFCCPNDDGHSVANASDAAFMATNSGETPWTMFCHHDSCKTASGGDRAWFLDRACERYGLEDASSLYEFSASARAAKEVAAETTATVVQAQTAGQDEVALRARATAFTAETAPAEIDALLQALATRQEGDLFVAELIDRIAETTGRKRGALEKRLKVLRKSLLRTLQETAAGEDGEDGGTGQLVHPIPDDLGEATIIWYDWPSAVRNKAALKRLERMNKDGEPRVFSAVNGGAVQLVPTDLGLNVVSMGSAHWHNLLVDQLDVRILRMDGTEESIDPPTGMRIYIEGAPAYDFPILRGVVKVPIFGPDGSLRTRRGYDRELGVFLAPDLPFYDVPMKPSADDVAAAISWLSEAVRDFPFTDSFDGDDPHPIKLEDRDEEGWQIPNPERGKASFANWLAMTLQPFVREIIGNAPCPFYHVDKASPGTGAGYLVDVASCISDGGRASISTLARNLDEIQKTITALLRAGGSTMFFDNVNHKVDSGDLAAMATSGKWKARILGVSEVCEIPVRQRVIFAGNNLEFSSEMMRRNVPIRLDANTPNPAQDRGPDAFKHNPLQDWCLAHRRELVWACHIIVQDWIAKGMKPGKAVLNSFDRWASTMSGILENIGITAFLASTNDYLQVRNDDVSGEEEFVQKIYREFQFEKADTRSILDCAKDASGGIAFELPIDATAKEHKQVSDMGRMLKRMMARTYHIDLTGPTTSPFKLGSGPAGRVEEVEGGRPKAKVKLLRRKQNGHVYWQLASSLG